MYNILFEPADEDGFRQCLHEASYDTNQVVVKDNDLYTNYYLRGEFLGTFLNEFAELGKTNSTNEISDLIRIIYIAVVFRFFGKIIHIRSI